MSGTSNLFESFYLSNNIPLDAKTVINSINTVNNEIPHFHRYLGLIFFTKTEKTFYTFKDSINIATPLLSNQEIANVSGLYISDDNYADLDTKLTKLKTVGKLVTIFPLGVTFVYTGTAWEYYKGIYKFSNNASFDTLPDTFKKKGEYIIIDNKNYRFKEDLSLVKEVETPNTTSNLENQLIFDGNGLIEIRNGKRIRLGGGYEAKNFQLNIGNNILKTIHSETKNFVPPKIKAIIWINRGKTSYPLDIPTKVVYDDTAKNYIVSGTSDAVYLGNIELKIE